MNREHYNDRLAKGQGLIKETIAILSVWEPSITIRDLKRKVVEEGILSKATELRVNDIVGRNFAARYLINNAKPSKQIKFLVQLGVPNDELIPLFFLYTARAHTVLYDFIIDVYWPYYSAGTHSIFKDNSIEFLQKAVNNGRAPSTWSEKIFSRVASDLLGCLVDFKLADRRHRNRVEILPYNMSSLASLYLAHELHFSDHSDNGIMNHSDWHLFGLEGIDVYRELQRVSNQHFILQYSGELLRISWKHKSMEEVFRGIVTTKF